MHFFANFEKVCMKNIVTEFVPVLRQLRKLFFIILDFRNKTPKSYSRFNKILSKAPFIKFIF